MGGAPPRQDSGAGRGWVGGAEGGGGVIVSTPTWLRSPMQEAPRPADANGEGGASSMSAIPGTGSHGRAAIDVTDVWSAIRSRSPC